MEKGKDMDGAFRKSREKRKILSVFGTRPETIKMAPLLETLSGIPALESSVCFTGQHRDLPESAMKLWGIRADYDLKIMAERQTPADVMSRILSAMTEVIKEAAPDLILVHGDTATTLAAALAGFYNHVPVGHVEAGLRTGDKSAPWPEEMNRTLVSDLAELHFCPTVSNLENLRREAVQGAMFITGNTVIDAMKKTVQEDFVFPSPALKALDLRGKKLIVFTCHRRENYGKPMEDIMEAVRELAARHEELEVVYPVHPSPAVRECASRILGDTPRVHLVDPVDVETMHNLIARSYLVMTDSGGLQEEAPALGKPVLVLRQTTERPEALQFGTVKLAGVQKEEILAAAEELLTDTDAYQRMARATSPYGDGHASERIAQGILWYFGLSDRRPEDYSPTAL